MTVGFIGACGFNTPHTQPRSSEINTVVEGRLGTESIAKNGVDQIRNMLEKYQMTVFPQGTFNPPSPIHLNINKNLTSTPGAAHTEFNPDCEPAVFVAGFASEDPGVEQAAQTLFGFDAELVEADLGVQSINGASIEDFRKVITANVALGVEQCLRKCGISKK